ncbi:YL1 nuclear protein, putative [Plasmodium ovale]|uniref:YL1 nuclear protein, putative n=2 Tax=Plasmodium ovale TaxID=36330 RepID=A0A1A8WWT1_PLAOA|nr:YL1 nuclear protein, putative [Plasmodium ovale curtisi]SBS96824.1 YL1 nuclear protein, putative [Plasmodium ovale curtisi]SCP05642.1 YL1 nuclear protein, putative [Plasmodium ovale]
MRKRKVGRNRRRKGEDVESESDASMASSAGEEEAEEAEADEEEVGEDEDEEGEDDEEEDEDDEEEDDDYELKNYGIALEMPQRKNRGKNLKKLIGEDLEKDEKFWNDSIWEEEEIDEEYVNSEGEEEYIDVTDSDFDDDEEDAEEEEEEDGDRNENELDEEEIKKKKKKMYSYLEKLNKQKRNNALKYSLMKKGKYDTAGSRRKEDAKQCRARAMSKREKENENKAEEVGVVEEDAGEEVAEADKSKNEKKLRRKKKIENAYLLLHRSTRDTTRQKTEQMQKISELRRIKKENRFKKFYENKKKKNSMQREMTREERLEEAKITEQYNIQSLLQLQAWEEEKKKYVENKRIVYYRPKDVFISFCYSKDRTLPSNENLKYDIDPYYPNGYVVELPNNSLIGNVLITSNANVLENSTNNNVVLEKSEDLVNTRRSFNVNQLASKEETFVKEGEDIPNVDQYNNVKVTNQKRENESDKVITHGRNHRKNDEKDKINNSCVSHQYNLENIDQCEDLNIEYLNENDALNFDCLKTGKNNINNDNILSTNVKSPNEQKEKNKKTIWREEKQMYIITDSNELSMYSNYNNNKEYLEEIKNKNNLCAITNLEGKYFDPLTKKYYNNADAFKLLRFFYHRKTYDNINEQISMIFDLFKSKLTEIEENTKNSAFDII